MSKLRGKQLSQTLAFGSFRFISRVQHQLGIEHESRDRVCSPFSAHWHTFQCRRRKGAKTNRNIAIGSQL